MGLESGEAQMLSWPWPSRRDRSLLNMEGVNDQPVLHTMFVTFETLFDGQSVPASLMPMRDGTLEVMLGLGSWIPA